MTIKIIKDTDSAVLSSRINEFEKTNPNYRIYDIQFAVVYHGEAEQVIYSVMIGYADDKNQQP
jgi:hypothetical protein